jgi:hypothetical protein
MFNTLPDELKLMIISHMGLRQQLKTFKLLGFPTEKSYYKKYYSEKVLPGITFRCSECDIPCEEYSESYLVGGMCSECFFNDIYGLNDGYYYRQDSDAESTASLSGTSI